jgi:hypothetical protein
MGCNYGLKYTATRNRKKQLLKQKSEGISLSPQGKYVVHVKNENNNSFLFKTIVIGQFNSLLEAEICLNNYKKK